MLLGRNLHRENGNISHPIPTPTTRKRKNDHRMYLMRSFGRRRPKNPKAIEITTANSRNA